MFVSLSLRVTGNNTWAGPESIRHNCPYPIARQAGFQGNFTLVMTGPGRLNATFVYKDGRREEGSGTFTNSRIALSEGGEEIIFVKR